MKLTKGQQKFLDFALKVLHDGPKKIQPDDFPDEIPDIPDRPWEPEDDDED